MDNWVIKTFGIFKENSFLRLFEKLKIFKNLICSKHIGLLKLTLVFLQIHLVSYPYSHVSFLSGIVLNCPVHSKKIMKHNLECKRFSVWFETWRLSMYNIVILLCLSKHQRRQWAQCHVQPVQNFGEFLNVNPIYKNCHQFHFSLHWCCKTSWVFLESSFFNLTLYLRLFYNSLEFKRTRGKLLKMYIILMEFGWLLRLGCLEPSSPSQIKD